MGYAMEELQADIEHSWMKAHCLEMKTWELAEKKKMLKLQNHTLQGELQEMDEMMQT